MDYQLVALIGMMVRHGRGEHQAKPLVVAGAAGLLFFVAGLIGWDLSRSNRFFRGTGWVDGPIWWQIGLGAALLLLAGVWARRVPPRPTPR